jgi:glutamine synthetase
LTAPKNPLRFAIVMEHEQIVFVGTSDLSGHFRGKSFPLSDLQSRLHRGVNLALTNLFLSAFGPIQFSPFGTSGEVLLIPDSTARVLVPFEGHSPEHFYLGDLCTLEGEPWEFCPRHILRRALKSLQEETGLTLLASFEQELVYTGVPAGPSQPYELDAYRRQGPFGELLLGAMRQAGVIPDSFLAEYGPRQYEVTSAPARGLRAADEAVITRELAQAVAFRLGHRVSLAPMLEAGGVTSGTHIHWSFLDGRNQPVLYDEARQWRISEIGGQFAAGILHHLNALCAVSAPAVASYYRLRPGGWAPAQNNIGLYDRGAAIRVCSVTSRDRTLRARQFNLEFRVADATCNPYLTLALMVQAGLEGIRSRRDLTQLTAQALPASLGDALNALQRSEMAALAMGPAVLAAYLEFKRAEIRSLEKLDENEICRRYAEVY